MLSCRTYLLLLLLFVGVCLCVLLIFLFLLKLMLTELVHLILCVNIKYWYMFYLMGETVHSFISFWWNFWLFPVYQSKSFDETVCVCSACVCVLLLGSFSKNGRRTIARWHDPYVFKVSRVAVPLIQVTYKDYMYVHLHSFYKTMFVKFYMTIDIKYCTEFYLFIYFAFLIEIHSSFPSV